MNHLIISWQGSKTLRTQNFKYNSLINFFRYINQKNKVFYTIF